MRSKTSVLTRASSVVILCRCKDGDTWNLRLALFDVNLMPLSVDSWIKLNTSSRTVYGLPLAVHAGLHQFLLTAFNRHNMMTSTPLEVSLITKLIHS